jgi:hypothetical protein
MANKNICGIIIAETASERDAHKNARKLKDCPYLLMQAIDSNRISSVYIVPKEQKWWIKYAEDYPDKVGFKKTKVYISDSIIVPERFKPRLPLIKKSISPCGAKCSSCPLKDKYKCLCCPATIHYRG